MEHGKGLRDLTPDEIAEAITRGVWIFFLEWVEVKEEAPTSYHVSYDGTTYEEAAAIPVEV